MPGPKSPGIRRLILVRHGITAFNAEGRWQGSLDEPLSEHGRAQARALAERLAGSGLGAVFASHLQRAQETARLAAPRLRGGTEPLLNELSYGAWEGMRDVEVGERWPEDRALWRSEPDRIRPGGGESLEELSERAWEGLLRCLRSTDGDLLVVAHGGTNRVLLARVLGAPLARFWAFEQAPTGVNILDIPAGPAEQALPRARVLLLNCTSHLNFGAPSR